MSNAKSTELNGLGVAQGIAIGPAYVLESDRLDVPVHEIEHVGRPDEINRFREAVGGVQDYLEELSRKSRTLPASAAEEVGFLLEAYKQMLDNSRLIRGAVARIENDGLNAEAAVSREVGEIVRAFANMNDTYLAERAKDVRDVGRRLIRNLMKSPYRVLTDLPHGTVVVSEELTPADTALLDPNNVAGFATSSGGAQDHTGILARSLGLPAVVGVGSQLDEIVSGDLIIVDGIEGIVYVNPDPATRAHFEERQDTLERQSRELDRLRNITATTRDGARIVLQANIDLANEIDPALRHGAEGIGLYRTEYLYLNRESVPDENEQYAHLRDIVERMEGRPVTIRTLDAGADKLPYSLARDLPASANPAMGLRAIRLSLRFDQLLESQLAAILRASAHGSIRILLPMISNVAEIRQVRQILTRIARRLRENRVPIAVPLPPVGVMIEIPGAALAADSLAQECDFFSIGTNDLTMYTLAIDRGNEQVAHLYNPLHPAVLRLIQFTTAAAHRASIPVNVCGEMAGDPRMSALLLGLGIRDLSMASSSVPYVKQRIRNMELSDSIRRAEAIMEQSDSGVVTALLDDFNTAL